MHSACISWVVTRVFHALFFKVPVHNGATDCSSPATCIMLFGGSQVPTKLQVTPPTFLAEGRKLAFLGIEVSSKHVSNRQLFRGSAVRKFINQIRKISPSFIQTNYVFVSSTWENYSTIYESVSKKRICML